MNPVTESALRTWWDEQTVDVRDLTAPPGGCRWRVARNGDPSSPCVLLAGHDGDCEDIEGYTADWQYLGGGA